MKYEFLATSSSGMDLYVVTVSDDTGKLEIRCNCAAGQNDVLCRHRIALITNKPRGVYATKRNNNDDLRAAIRLLSTYGVDRRYAELQAMYENLEQQWLTVRSQIKTAMNDLVSSKV